MLKEVVGPAWQATQCAWSAAAKPVSSMLQHWYLVSVGVAFVSGHV
jgi:hypothetical protein